MTEARRSVRSDNEHVLSMDALYCIVRACVMIVTLRR